MLAELKKLADNFSAQPTTRGREMRELLEHSPKDFCAAAVEVLVGDDSERVKRYLVALLWTNDLLIPCLCDPSTPPGKAESIANLAKRVDPQFPSKLFSFLLEHTELEPPERIERILGLLKSMPEATCFRPLLTPLLQHPNDRVRAKVALLAGEGNGNRTWFERRMQEDDPRVRANAIESASPAMSQGLRELYRGATSDHNNRVAANALLALYRAGDVEAIAKMHEMISRPEPLFRASAVWAMGETGDTRFVPLLARIVTDPNETIKAAAFRAIRKLRSPENGNALPIKVRVLGEPARDGSKLRIAFGVLDHSQSVPHLAGTAVRILVNGEFVYRYSVAEQESSRRISAAFLLPRTINLPWEQIDGYREALERCFEQRRRGDGWILAQHSASGGNGGRRQETLFGVRLESREGSNIRMITSAADLRNAIESRDSLKCPEFSSTFLELCRELGASRGNAHLFLLHPEAPGPIDPETLIEAAEEAHVTVNAVCGLPDAGIRRICRASGGFYTNREDIPEALAALYRGIMHRYEAEVGSPEVVNTIQVGVSSTKYSGESPVMEMSR